MRLGFHVGVSRGYAETVAYAKRVGCTAVQFFSGNPKTYRVAPIDTPALERFIELRQENDLSPAVIHTSYLINLASEDANAAKNSLRLLENDLAFAAVGKLLTSTRISARMVRAIVKPDSIAFARRSRKRLRESSRA